MGCTDSKEAVSAVAAAPTSASKPVAEDAKLAPLPQAAPAEPVPATITEKVDGAAHHDIVAFTTVVSPLEEAPTSTAPDSPETQRVTDRKREEFKDDIPVISDADDDDDSSPQPSMMHGLRAGPRPGHPHADMVADTASRPAFLNRQESTKADMASAVILDAKGRSSQPSTMSFFGKNTPDDPIECALNFLAPTGANRYQDTTISLTDDEEDDLDGTTGFDMQRWKRYYQWNKKKSQDLLRFLWKRFDEKEFSFWCVSYKLQDAMFAPYQGENIIHGLACRVEKLLSQLDFFAVMHALMDRSADQHKVLGVFLLKGQSIPLVLADIAELSDLQFMKADTQDPLVRTFVAGIVAGQCPVQGYDIVATRECL